MDFIINDDNKLVSLMFESIQGISESVSLKYTKNFKDVEYIVNRLSKKDKLQICNGSFKKSPYTKYREIICVNNIPVSFLEVYELPQEKGVGYIVIATIDEYRGNGYSKLLVKRFLSNRAVNKFNVIAWKYQKGNDISKNIAKQLGFDNEEDNTLYLKPKYINESIIEESSNDKSSIDRNHKQNGHMKLSEFKLSKTQNNDEGKSYNLQWTDKDNKTVGKVRVDSIPASDGYRWFGSLNVSKKYRGYDLGNQILEFIISKYKAGALAVHKDNEIACNLYKKHGFKIDNERKSNDYYYMYLKRNKEKINESSLLPFFESAQEDEELREKINAIQTFNDHEFNKVVLYPTSDLDELEGLYLKYMTLDEEDKVTSNIKATEVFGKTNDQIYIDTKRKILKTDEEPEDKYVMDNETVEDEMDSNSVFSNDLPLFTPNEFFEKFDEDYSCFTESESEIIREWRTGYALLGNGIKLSNYNSINLKRINILRKAIYENNTDAILQCGWIPGVEFNSENRVKATELVKSKIEKSNIILYKDINESIIEEAANDDLYPIYVTLFSNDTKFGKLIRKVTGSPYSHATVSLDHTLNDMYSFSDIPFNHDTGTSAGFVRESIYSPMYQKNRYFTVFVTFTDKEGVKRFKEKLNVFKTNYTNYDYNDLGLVQYFFKMKNTKKHDESKKMKWFCSEFVSYMLYISTGFDEFKNVLQSPDDLQYKEDMIELGQYTIKSFNEKDLIRKTKNAKKEFIRRRKNKEYTNELCDITFENYIPNSEIQIIEEAKKKKNKDYVVNEKDVNKYTQIIDWKYLYDEFLKIYKNTDPDLRFNLFEIIIRNYIVPLNLRVDKTMDIIVSELRKIYKLAVLPFGKLIDIDVYNRTIKINNKSKSTLITYPDFNIKDTFNEAIQYEEDYIEEAKSAPIQFDSDGNLILKNLRKINFEQEYANSHRLLIEYDKTDSYEPMKHELAKMQFFITLLEKKIYKQGKDKSMKELKVRARFLNDFKKYLKIIIANDPDFNFTQYYEQSPFNDALIKIDKSTLKFGWEALKYVIKG